MENNILKVSLDLFSLNTIRTAISIYDGLAKIRIAALKENSAYLQFENCEFGCDRTQKEFMNYIINIESTRI
jgi:hypothetical protein